MSDGLRVELKENWSKKYICTEGEGESGKGRKKEMEN